MIYILGSQIASKTPEFNYFVRWRDGNLGTNCSLATFMFGRHKGRKCYNSLFTIWNQFYQPRNSTLPWLLLLYSLLISWLVFIKNAMFWEATSKMTLNVPYPLVCMLLCNALPLKAWHSDLLMTNKIWQKW